VTLLYRLLCMLIFVRVMCPPGVCLCKLSVLPARLAAHVFATGKEVPLPPAERDDEHDDGCPCSPFSAGMGLRTSDVPQHAIAFVAPSLDLALEAPTLATFEEMQLPPLAWPPEEHLYLTHCSILI
jgi:hypothetical protein